MKTPSSYPVLDNRPIDQWKVTELKEELKRRKLMTKGLKDDLIRRLDEALRNENDSAKEDIDNGLDGTPPPVVETGDAGTVQFVSETTVDVIDHSNNRNEVGCAMDQAHVDDTAVTLSEGKVQEEETGGIDSATNEEMVVHATSKETSMTVNENVVSEIAVNVQEADSVVSEVAVNVQESESVVSEVAVNMQESQSVVSEIAVDVQESQSVVSEIAVDVQESQSVVSELAVDVQESQSVVSEIAVDVQESQSVVSEIAVNVQESQNNDSQNERGDSKSQMENEDIKPLHEDVGLNSSEPNNQVSEVSTVLGFQVKSDSISSDCVSINEKNELKDNIIADNVKLELDVKPEMVLPSSSNILPVPDGGKLHPVDVEEPVPDGGKLHPMDVEEPHVNKVQVEERDDKADNAEMSKKNDIADVISSEKLNLDRSSGDDSMEDDALESKQIDSKYNLDEVGDRSEKIEVTMAKEEAPVDVMQDDIHVEKKNIHDENKNVSAATTVKRKIHDQEVVGNNETSKRQRRWNSENLKVPEPQSYLTSSTTPKDTFPLKRNFSRSDSTASDDAPKERVVPPSPKPPTNSLRIDRFLRPFTLKAVQELLGKTGSVTSFWMDHIKTHCYVTYASVEEAIETRNAVYNLQWPSNGGRLLVAEFVDPQEVKVRVEAPPPQSPATPVSTGPTIPPAAPPTLQPQPPSRQQVQRQQLPPPPPLPLPPPPPLSNPPPARERLQLPPPPPLPEKVDAPIVTLDDLFRKTKAIPRIYYLPLSDEQVAAKLKSQEKGIKQSAGGVACREELFQARWYGGAGSSSLMDFGFFPQECLGLRLSLI